MNYELAKELKDAGFPQLEDKTNHNSGPGGYVSGWSEEEGDLVHAYIPTLSELIEACREKSVRPLTLKVDYVTNYSHAHMGVMYGATGDTPEEAVALLWLALNKK